MINRYDPSMQYIGTGEYIPCAELEECGDFVKYEDHLAELSSLRLKLEECQKALKYIATFEKRADESIGMVDMPHAKALRAACKVADEAIRLAEGKEK